MGSGQWLAKHAGVEQTRLLDKLDCLSSGEKGLMQFELEKKIAAGGPLPLVCEAS